MGRWMVPAASLLGAGWFFATAVILGVIIGVWADEKTGLEPAFTLIGIVLGLAIAAVGGYRMLRPLMRRLGEDGPEQG